MNRAILSLLASLIVLTLAAHSSADVTIKQAPVAASTRNFDPKHPPDDMPALRPDEAAVTESKYACGVQIEVEIIPRDNDKATLKITGVTADLKLDVVIWLPDNAPAKIKAHENGHRQIAEQFYKNGDDIAKKIGEKYIGKQVAVDSADQKDTRPVIQRLANEFCGEYLGQTEVPSEKVQQKYDDLTDHGRNKLPEKDAIKRATEESAADK